MSGDTPRWVRWIDAPESDAKGFGRLVVLSAGVVAVFTVVVLVLVWIASAVPVVAVTVVAAACWGFLRWVFSSEDAS